MKKEFLFLFLSILFCFSCSDNFVFNVENQSGTPIALDAEEIGGIGILNIKEKKSVYFAGKKSHFKLKILKNNLIETFEFADTDHWFGTTHTILVEVGDGSIILKGNNGERFYNTKN